MKHPGRRDRKRNDARCRELGHARGEQSFVPRETDVARAMREFGAVAISCRS